MPSPLIRHMLLQNRPKAGGFVGAYDAIPSIVAAYGMRRLRSAYSGAILRLRRSSDSAEQDIGYTGSGDLDTAAVATFIGAGSGFVRTWYDQSGNAYDAAQATTTNQPLYVASGQNGMPVGRWDGVTDLLDTTVYLLSSLPSGTVLASAIPRLLSATMTVIGDGWCHLNTDSAPKSLSNIYNPTDGDNTALGGTVITTVSQLFTMQWDNVSLRHYRNGTLDGINTNSTNGTAARNFTPYIGARHGRTPTQYFNGDISELIICNSALSTANRQAAESAANAYWAIY